MYEKISPYLTLALIILLMASVLQGKLEIAEQRETITKLEATIMELRREVNEPIQTSQLAIPDPETVDLAVRIIEQEAGNQGAEGKLAVASVLMNRVNDPRFPDDIKSVITSRGQFESYESGRYTRVSVSKDSHRAFEKALAGNVITEAVYFCNYENIGTKARRWFDSLEEVDQIGDHRFYK